MQADTLQKFLVSRVRLRQLNMLVTVGEQGNILKASHLLNVAQPALTKTIRELENSLGLVLFDRSPRGVTPTPYGKVLIRRASAILAQVKYLGEELSSLKEGVTGHVGIGTLLAASPALLPRSLVKLKRRFKHVAVTVTEGTNDRLLPILLQGDIDMIVGRLPEVPENEGVDTEILYYEPVVVVARYGHPLAKARNLSLKRLAGQQWILPPPGTTLRQELAGAFHAAGLDLPARSIESVSILTNQAMLMETDMIAVMPSQVLETCERSDGLRRLPINIRASEGPVGLTTRSGIVLSPAAQHLAEAIRNVAKELKIHHHKA